MAIVGTIALSSELLNFQLPIPRLRNCGLRTFVIVENFPLLWTMIIWIAVEIVDRANVLGKKKIECPVERNPDLFVQAWKFAEINRSPHPPREEAGEIESKNPGYAHAPAD